MKKKKQLKHDSLAKTIMSDPVAAQELLEHYLPVEFKSLVDLSKISIEQESYIEESLNKKYSDIVYKIKTKDEEEAFVYVLIETQSTVDYWIALRLWKYTLLLCERHKKGRNKLPLIYNLVIYNGTKVYNAPRNFWDLFTDSVMAKELLTKDYHLIDLQNMPDEEIIKKKHLGMLEYLLKHIHQRDMIRLWEQFLTSFKHVIMLDKEKGYIYLKSFLWYSDTKLAAEQQPELVEVLAKHLASEDQENIMRTIADKYIDEGIIQGIQIGKNEGIQIGKNEGIQIGKNEGIKIRKNEGIQIGESRGKAERNIEVAKNMLAAGSDPAFISKVTGLEQDIILSLIKHDHD